MARPAASSTELFTRLPVESLSKAVSNAMFVFKKARWAVIEAKLVLIESGIVASSNECVYLQHPD